MRKFLITVNGKAYEVEVEEVSDFVSPPVHQAPAVQTQVPQASSVQAAKAVPEAPAPAAAIPASGTKIHAPMPGKILSVKVSPGQAVKRGTVLMILEAMKMENEIQAPVDGEVTAIAVSEGATVNAGVLLACIG